MMTALGSSNFFQYSVKVVFFAGVHEMMVAKRVISVEAVWLLVT